MCHSSERDLWISTVLGILYAIVEFKPSFFSERESTFLKAGWRGTGEKVSVLKIICAKLDTQSG